MNESEFSAWLIDRKVDLSALPTGWPLDEKHVSVTDDGRAVPIDPAAAKRMLTLRKRAIRRLARNQRSCSCGAGLLRQPRQLRGRQRASHGGRHSSTRSSARSGDSPDSGSDDPAGDPDPPAGGGHADRPTGPGAPCHWCGETIADFKRGASRRTPSHAKTCSENCAKYLRDGRKRPEGRPESEPRMVVRRVRVVDAFEAEVDPRVLEVFELESQGRVWHGHRRHPQDWRASYPVAA